MKTLRPYQVDAVKRGVNQNLLIGDACGCGKTITAIGVILETQAKIGKPVLIVAPSAIVKRQWYQELQSMGVADDRIIWLDSTTKSDPYPYADMIILTHYEAMRKHLVWLQDYYFSVIVADEAHRIKNRHAKRTEDLKTLKAFRKIALTGTAYDRNPADIWSILNWLEPDFFASYWRFFEAHINSTTITVRNQIIKQVVPSAPLRDPKGFSRLLRQFMIARKKEDIRADMPPRNDIYIDLDMSPQQARAYAKIRDAADPIVSLADDLDVSVAIILTQILREIQITTDPALLGLPSGHSVKLDWVDEWLKDNPDESVIIFTRFRETAQKIASEHSEFTLIMGGQRPTVDSSTRRIVGTIAAAGEGLDLPHIDNAIFIDVEFSSILMQQAIDRIHRINIDNAKNVYFLRCVGSVDMLLHDALAGKWATKELVAAYMKGRTCLR